MFRIVSFIKYCHLLKQVAIHLGKPFFQNEFTIPCYVGFAEFFYHEGHKGFFCEKKNEVFFVLFEPWW